MRLAFVALLIVGSCSGGGGGTPDARTSSSTASAQTQQATGPSNSTQATLYWDPVTKPPVDGYRLHYGTRSRAYTAQIDTGNVTSWTVQNLAPNTYYFAVTAVKAGYGESNYSNEASKTINGGSGANPAAGTSPPVQSAQAAPATSTSPPVQSVQAAPALAEAPVLPTPEQVGVLQAPAQGPGQSTQATISWNPVTQPPVDGYRVYYGSQSGAYTAHIDTGNVTSWTLQNLAPDTYYFAVTAVKAGYGESGYSNEVSTTINGGNGG